MLSQILHTFINGATGEWDSDAFAEVLISLRDLSLLQGFAQEPTRFFLYPSIFSRPNYEQDK